MGGMPLSVDYSDIDSLEQVIENFGENSYRIINDVLHNESAEIIKNNIQMLLPSSGRKWKGKKAAASSTQPLREDTNELLSIVIRSKSAYNYLYFPDDGNNTERHHGNQHFMQQGADNSINRIVELCTGKLIDNFNQGG